MNDIDFLIQSFVDIVKKQFQSKDVEYFIKFICCSTNLSNAGRQKVMVKHNKDVEYFIKFICCSTNLSNAGRQKVMVKHKSHSQKELHAKRKKES